MFPDQTKEKKKESYAWVSTHTGLTPASLASLRRRLVWPVEARRRWCFPAVLVFGSELDTAIGLETEAADIIGIGLTAIVVVLGEFEPGVEFSPAAAAARLKESRLVMASVCY